MCYAMTLRVNEKLNYFVHDYQNHFIDSRDSRFETKRRNVLILQ